MILPIREPDDSKGFLRALALIALANRLTVARRVDHRHHDIAERRRPWKEMKTLEDKSHEHVAQLRARVVV
jgi:hypothetical protein